eukprot:SAG22_NODE_16972_length_313_cov_2.084112_1_plen_74_part_01
MAPTKAAPPASPAGSLAAAAARRRPAQRGKLFCEDFFRTGGCGTGKRCKFAHSESIAHLRGVPAAPGLAAPYRA